MDIVTASFWLGIAGSVSSLIALVTVWPIFKHRFLGLFSRSKFVVIGAPGVGKTSLLCYMQGKLAPRHHIITQGLDDIYNINLSLGGRDSMYFQARVVREIGGEYTGRLFSTMKSINPKGVILIVDGISDASEAQVIKDFGLALNDFVGDFEKNTVNLRCVLIIINKYDIYSGLPTGKVISEFKERYHTLYAFFDKKLPNVHVNICCGSLTESQFFSPIDDGLKFVTRAINHGR